MKQYILDANIFITPYQKYYSFDLAPSFWKQFARVIARSNVQILDVVKQELQVFHDDLAKWISEVPNLSISTTKDTLIAKNYATILHYISECPFYTTEALKNWSDIKIADPWIIAVAIKDNAVIVTFEQSISQLSIKNKTNKVKIPDVAKHFNINCVDLFDFMRDMNIKL